jgi:predicted RNA binding protein YcfA (HicA-like mRNA interferase family)
VNFRDFIKILEANGFKMVRQESSHRRYRGLVGGDVKFVTVAYHQITDNILPKTFASMIRQSGLSKKLFQQK